MILFSNRCVITFVLIAVESISYLNGLYYGSQPPVWIDKVNPTYGSMVGGTILEIYGGNFMVNGMSTELEIFVGDNLCIIDKYHTNSDKVVCSTPACRTTTCQLDQVNIKIFTFCM